MKSIFKGGARVAGALLVGSLIFSATPSVAETPSRQFPEPQNQNQEPQKVAAAAIVRENAAVPTESPSVPASDASSTGATVSNPTVSDTAESIEAAPPTSYVATAYSLRGRTASGKMVAKGLIAADPRVLPLGSRVHVQAGGYSGEYLVADTGGKIRGRRIDIWIPSAREAMRFGRRNVKLTVLSYGGKRSAGNKRAKAVVATPTAVAVPVVAQ